MAIGYNKNKEKHCPECDSVNIVRKSSRGGNRQRENPENYHCRYCGEHFDDPKLVDKEE